MKLSTAHQASTYVGVQDTLWLMFDRNTYIALDNSFQQLVCCCAVWRPVLGRLVTSKSRTSYSYGQQFSTLNLAITITFRSDHQSAVSTWWISVSSGSWLAVSFTYSTDPVSLKQSSWSQQCRRSRKNRHRAQAHQNCFTFHISVTWINSLHQFQQDRLGIYLSHFSVYPSPFKLRMQHIGLNEICSLFQQTIMPFHSFKLTVTSSTWMKTPARSEIQ